MDAKIVENGNDVVLDLEPWDNGSGNILIRESESGHIECKPLTESELRKYAGRRLFYKMHICVPFGTRPWSAEAAPRFVFPEKTTKGTKKRRKRKGDPLPGQGGLF